MFKFCLIASSAAFTGHTKDWNIITLKLNIGSPKINNKQEKLARAT